MLAISLLANTVSLTPGTVSAYLSADRRCLIIHSLHTTDAGGAAGDHSPALRDAAKGDPGSMLSTAVYIAFGLVSIALLLSFWRLLLGPSKPDRILALDTLYVNTVALLVLLGIHLRSNLYFEAALLIAMIGFVSTVALSKFLTRGDIIE